MGVFKLYNNIPLLEFECKKMESWRWLNGFVGIILKCWALMMEKIGVWLNLLELYKDFAEVNNGGWTTFSINGDKEEKNKFCMKSSSSHYHYHFRFMIELLYLEGKKHNFFF